MELRTHSKSNDKKNTGMISTMLRLGVMILVVMAVMMVLILAVVVSNPKMMLSDALISSSSSAWNSFTSTSASGTGTGTGTTTSRVLTSTSSSGIIGGDDGGGGGGDSSVPVRVMYDATVFPTSMLRKFQHELATATTTTTTTSSPLRIEAVPLNVHQNPLPSFVKNVPGASERVEALLQAQQPHLALEVLKYCGFLETSSGLFIDATSSVLMDTLEHVLDGIHDPAGGKSKSNNIAVLNDGFLPSSIHGALLYLHPANANTVNRKLAQQMLDILITTRIETLVSNPTLLPKSLYDLIAVDSGVATLTLGVVAGAAGEQRWFLLQHSCTIEPLGGRPATAPISTYALQSYRLTQNCPEPNGFCCSIVDPIGHAPVMMTKHLMLPYQILPDVNHLPTPFNAEAGHYEEEDLPFISSVREVVHSLPEGDTTPRLTPNFFEILLQNDCLPSDVKCSDCLRDKRGADCHKCASACPCYCKTLCHIPVEEKFITKSLTVRPPLYARDPSRLIPRIVHQTWFEDVTPEKYPNMSRLIESFKQSGWEYKFYTDDESVNFLSTHFPPEIRQAYDALRPGAFKADLFRYCVLLIHGGVYADMDIMLEANLDLAVANDVGFMVPQDEPGTPINHRMCLWNGFIAAAPGHPFLAKVIETVVNNVRNRFTSVDVDHLFCPDPELSVLHAFDTLFTAGPCILGAMVNKVLGRHGQTPFEAGEIDIWESSKKAALEKGTDFVIGPDDRPSARIPGKTIILHQNKWDMGAHRFTLLDRNVVVAATDLPDADDRANQEKTQEHYSKTHVKAGIYGLDKLYTDNVKANEELRFYVDAQWKLLSSSSSSTTMTQ